MTTCVKCGAALPSESNAVGWGHAVDVCRATTECALRAELRDVRADLADARARLDSGPDDPTAIESVVERLLTCGTGPSPEGWSGGAVAVGRRDVAEVIRALRDTMAERDSAVAQQAQHYADLLAAEQRIGDLRAAVLAIAAEMTHEDRHVRHGAWAVRLREAVGK